MMSNDVFERFQQHIANQKEAETPLAIFESFIDSNSIGIHKLEDVCYLMALVPKIKKGLRRMARTKAVV